MRQGWTEYHKKRLAQAKASRHSLLYETTLLIVAFKRRARTTFRRIVVFFL